MRGAGKCKAHSEVSRTLWVMGHRQEGLKPSDLISDLVPLVCLKKSLFAFNPSRILLSHAAEPPASQTLNEHIPMKTMLA